MCSLLGVGNQWGSFIMDVCRALKQSGLDRSFNSGLTVMSLKKKGKKMDWESQTIHQGLLRQAALCCFLHCINISEGDQAGFTSRPLRTFALWRTSSLWSDLLQIVSLPDLIWYRLRLLLRRELGNSKWTPHFFFCWEYHPHPPHTHTHTHISISIKAVLWVL